MASMSRWKLLGVPYAFGVVAGVCIMFFYLTLHAAAYLTSADAQGTHRPSAIRRIFLETTHDKHVHLRSCSQINNL